MISEGEQAPAITVSASDGSSVNLTSPGQPLVLYFYPKDHNGSDAVGKPIASGTAL